MRSSKLSVGTLISREARTWMGGSTRSVIIRWRVIGRRRVIGPSVISVIIRRRRERHERRNDDRSGGADDRSRDAERPKQREWRTRGIVLRFGGRDRHSGECRGERGRNRNLAETHWGLPDYTGRSR